jgi:hypothetical protein
MYTSELYPVNIGHKPNYVKFLVSILLFRILSLISFMIMLSFMVSEL